MALSIVYLGFLELFFTQSSRLDWKRSSIFYLSYKPSDFESLAYLSFPGDIPKIVLEFGDLLKGTDDLGRVGYNNGNNGGDLA